jgi:hypothetical protein
MLTATLFSVFCVCLPLRAVGTLNAVKPVRFLACLHKTNLGRIRRCSLALRKQRLIAEVAFSH